MVLQESIHRNLKIQREKETQWEGGFGGTQKGNGLSPSSASYAIILGQRGKEKVNTVKVKSIAEMSIMKPADNREKHSLREHSSMPTCRLSKDSLYQKCNGLPPRFSIRLLRGNSWTK